MTVHIDHPTVNEAELVRLANVFYDRVRETFPDADVDVRADNYPNDALHLNSVTFTVVTGSIAFTQKVMRGMIAEAVSADELMRSQADFCVRRIKRMLGQV
jgi:hypothetical protein